VPPVRRVMGPAVQRPLAARFMTIGRLCVCFSRINQKLHHSWPRKSPPGEKNPSHALQPNVFDSTAVQNRPIRDELPQHARPWPVEQPASRPNNRRARRTLPILLGATSESLGPNRPAAFCSGRARPGSTSRGPLRSPGFCRGRTAARCSEPRRSARGVAARIGKHPPPRLPAQWRSGFSSRHENKTNIEQR